MISVEFNNVAIQINDFKIKNLNVKLPTGTTLGIVGRNGSGKTTIIKAIAGVYELLSGDIIINGQNRYIDEVGYLKQIGIVNDIGLFNYMIKPKLINKLLKKTYIHFDEDYFKKYLLEFDIDFDKRLHKMSQGERKKVNIISVLSLNPKVLILDEPMANIDPISKVEITELLENYLKLGNTIIYSTNQTEELDRIADYLLFLEKGEVILKGLKENIFNSHYIIDIKEEELNQVKKSLIGFKKSDYGYEGLTNIKNLVNDNKYTYRIPKIEDLMFYYIKG